MKHNIKGFTLLELVVVVALLGMVATLATDFTVFNTNQVHFDVTKKRVEMIRYAVVGDDSRTLNGQPTISGFVADTGRMPNNIRELLVEGSCSDTTYFDSITCIAATETWAPISNWNGPYLTSFTTELVTDGGGTDVNIPVFRDGWGTISTVDDMANFGWLFTLTSGDLTVQSLGLDRAVGAISLATSDTFVFEQDYPTSGGSVPPLVSESDYENGPFTVSYTITNNTSSAVDVCLIWEGVTSGDSGTVNINAGSAHIDSFSEGTSGFIEFELTTGTGCSTDVPILDNRKAVHPSIGSISFTAEINP